MLNNNKDQNSPTVQTPLIELMEEEQGNFEKMTQAMELSANDVSDLNAIFDFLRSNL